MLEVMESEEVENLGINLLVLVVDLYRFTYITNIYDIGVVVVVSVDFRILYLFLGLFDYQVI